MEKKLHQRVAELAAQPTAPSLEVWYQDEARLGLKPIVRRVWARRGQRPRARTATRYEWLYVYGFVHPHSGRCYWLILPTVNTGAMSLALAEFARDGGAGPDKRIVLVVDNAGWHTSHAVELPPGIECFFLRAYTPERQPPERLWPLIREGVANQTFADLDALQTRLVDRCLSVSAARPVVRRFTNFHWLPQR